MQSAATFLDWILWPQNDGLYQRLGSGTPVENPNLNHRRIYWLPLSHPTGHSWLGVGGDPKLSATGDHNFRGSLLYTARHLLDYHSIDHITPSGGDLKVAYLSGLTCLMPRDRITRK
jgi:hypothetical protein